MKTTSWTRKQFRQLAGAGVLMLTACLASANAQTNAPATAANPPKSSAAPIADADQPELDNWLDIGGGYNFVSGDKAQYQKQSELPARGYGGITAFHYETPLGKKGQFSADGRGIYDNHDYELKLDVSHPDIGYVSAGVNQYREYYDGHGSYFRPNGLSFAPPIADPSLDRGTFFFETGLTLPDWPVLKIRYEHDFRSGEKDSTEWGTTTLTGPGQANNTGTLGQKKIAPAFRMINEKTDSISADLTDTIKNTDLGIGLRSEWIRNSDSQNILFFPGQNNAQGDSHTLTQADGDHNDIFNVHASTDTTLSDKVEFTTGYSYTTMQDEMFGSRLDSPNVAVGGDTRYANLAGVSDMEQYEMDGSVMWTPMESLFIVPSARIEKMDESGLSSDNAVTGNPGNNIGALTAQSDNESDVNFAQSLDARYTGFTNWVLYVRGDFEENRANLALVQGAPPNPSPLLTNDWHQGVQKYTVGANWYPLRGLNFAAQYYHKFDDNNYANVTPSPTAYPGFVGRQNFNVDDANFRVTCRLIPQVTLVSRYDFQMSTIETTGFGLNSIQSGENTTHMFGESLSWTPLNRLYLTLSANYVLDTTHTPADSLTTAPIGGIPIAGVVQSSKNDYWTVNGTVGYAINDKTQVSTSYNYYRSPDYSDNSSVGVPYGAGGEQHNVSATLQRQVTRNLRWALTYSYASYRDALFGGQLDYTAQSVLSSVQYRF